MESETLKSRLYTERNCQSYLITLTLTTLKTTFLPGTLQNFVLKPHFLTKLCRIPNPSREVSRPPRLRNRSRHPFSSLSTSDWIQFSHSYLVSTHEYSSLFLRSSLPGVIDWRRVQNSLIRFQFTDSNDPVSVYWIHSNPALFSFGILFGESPFEDEFWIQRSGFSLLNPLESSTLFIRDSLRGVAVWRRVLHPTIWFQFTEPTCIQRSFPSEFSLGSCRLKTNSEFTGIQFSFRLKFSSGSYRSKTNTESIEQASEFGIRLNTLLFSSEILSRELSVEDEFRIHQEDSRFRTHLNPSSFSFGIAHLTVTDWRQTWNSIIVLSVTDYS